MSSSNFFNWKDFFNQTELNKVINNAQNPQIPEVENEEDSEHENGDEIEDDGGSDS